MGHYKHLGDGDLSLISGKGRAEYGASTVRTGTFTNPELNPNSGDATKTITFSSPMPDADYCLDFTMGAAWLANIVVISKTTTGFTVCFLRPYSSAVAADKITFTYTAFKLYTDTEYNGLLTVQSGTTSESTITWNRSGNVVTVSVYNFVGPGSVVEATGLPKCGGYALAHMCASGTSTPTGAIQISKNDTKATIYGVPNGTTVYGSVTYITSDPL